MPEGEVSIPEGKDVPESRDGPEGDGPEGEVDIPEGREMPEGDGPEGDARIQKCARRQRSVGRQECALR